MLDVLSLSTGVEEAHFTQCLVFRVTAFGLTVDLFSGRAHNHSRLPELKLSLRDEWARMCRPYTEQSRGTLRLSGRVRVAGPKHRADGSPRPRPSTAERARLCCLLPSPAYPPPPIPRVAHPSLPKFHLSFSTVIFSPQSSIWKINTNSSVNEHNTLVRNAQKYKTWIL